ncbi:MAG TPA: universal stress protein [Planctomycetota bacterium]
MIRKILATLDGGKISESILAHVEPLRKAFDADLTLATVIPEHSSTLTGPALSYLESRAKPLREGGWRVDAAVLTGKPADAIATFAADEGYGLLALCSRGSSGLRRLLLGSVAEEILRQASVPVFVAHPPADGAEPFTKFRAIVVYQDGTHRAMSVLPCVVEMARAHGAKLTFVTVVPPTRTDGLPADTICHNLYRERDRLKAEGLDVDVVVLYGDPAAELLSFVAKSGADLIATATHGRTGMDRLRHGSVTEEIFRGGATRMLVFRAPAVVRDHPVHGVAIEARRRALAVLASAGEQDKGPYSG